LADALYGPITTICCNGQIMKKIPWSAFMLAGWDWEQVKDVRDILKVSLFSMMEQTQTNLY